MLKLKLIIGASVCAAALGFSVSVSASGTGTNDIDWDKILDGANVDVSDVGDVLDNTSIMKNTSFFSDISSTVKDFSPSGLTNLNNLGDLGVSFLKDMSPEIKQLMSMSFGELGLGDLLGGLGGGGYPVLMPGNTAQSVANTATSETLTQETEALLDAEVDLTASFGPEGNMDGRMGQCVINGEDYSQPITQWLTAVGPKLEGTCPWLYLDTYCWPTIGVGSLLGKDYKTMAQTFMPMEYVDASGNVLSKDVQQNDLRTIYNLHAECRGKLKSDPAGAKKIYNYLCSGNHWKNMFNGRRISDKAMYSASFDEICDKHVKVWANYWKQLGISYTKLPLLHQVFVIDVSYQAGGGAVKGKNDAYLPNRTAVWGNLAKRNCSSASSSFASQRLCTEFSERCRQRRSMINQGCSGS
ncbi:MAG: hypothetical protein IKV03_02420 [Alphaproteobacteria bacterium]|nr:hypothetical protein [Alphaproteobacteria bacterium]